MGKHKPIYDAAGPSLLRMQPYGMLYSLLFQADCGDYVVVTNAKKVKVTGRKEDQVLYRKHTMYPGGLKEIKYKEMMKRKPDEVRRAMHGSQESQKFILFHISLCRSFARQCLECCLKTSCGRGDWKGSAFSPMMLWVFSSTIL